jgi:hypothetical protein
MTQEEKERRYFTALLRYSLLHKAMAAPSGYRTSFEELDYWFAPLAPWLETDGVIKLLRELVRDEWIAIRVPGPQTISNSQWERSIEDPIIVLPTVLTAAAADDLGKWISKEQTEIQL